MEKDVTSATSRNAAAPAAASPSTDLTFITNEPGKHLRDRFGVLLGEEQKPVERLVARILSAKKRDSGADVSAFEREIDKLVYGLYGLTAEEIKIVEGTGK
jgi:hypothetical protein